jgi:hypothetical protein
MAIVHVSLPERPERPGRKNNTVGSVTIGIKRTRNGSPVPPVSDACVGWVSVGRPEYIAKG